MTRLTIKIDKCFIINNGNVGPRDIELFFAGIDNVIQRPSSTTMLDLLVECGLFPSKSRARKNGWANKEVIPTGYSEFTIGKLRHSLAIFNPSEPPSTN